MYRRARLLLGLVLLTGSAILSRLIRRRALLSYGLVLLIVATVLIGRERRNAAERSSVPAPATAPADSERAIQHQTVLLERRVAELEQALARQRRRDAATTPVDPLPLQRDFQLLQAQLPGNVGVVFGPPGGPAVALGSFSSGPAWSTIKVPIAIEYVRRFGGSSDSMRQALTVSDNAAAMTLWDALAKTGSARGAKVEQVLADAGDRTTHVQAEVVRAGFTPFGQTQWSLRAQQAFATRLPCLAGATPVLSLMGQVDPSQQWGLGHIGSRPQFKGGWGPDTRGAYLVRQFGLIHLRSGTVAVAIAAQPADGSFTSGVRYLDLLAAWIGTHAVGGRLTC